MKHFPCADVCLLFVHLAASFNAHDCFQVPLVVDVHGGAWVENLLNTFENVILCLIYLFWLDVREYLKLTKQNI